MARQAQRDPTGVTDARRALLERLIDHAALFPPASMDMPDAMAADRAARASEHAWMIDRFICPASRLAELPDDTPALSVVLDADLDRVDEARVAGRDIRLIEARALPDLARLDPGVQVFWECSDVRAAADAGVGAKIRCGGVIADAFPPPEAVAAFVAACRDAGVRFKATAGLHHPVRHVDPATGFHMHGFLNLLAAASFAAAHNLRPGGLERVLAEEDPEAFEVAADGIRVGQQRASSDEIEAARRHLFVSYGSCSWREPVEDLQALGVLE
jgi:hypothetical protein